MCRLGVYTGKDIWENIDEFSSKFSLLEKKLGGDGNSLFLIGAHVNVPKGDGRMVTYGNFRSGEKFTLFQFEALVDYTEVDYTKKKKTYPYYTYTTYTTYGSYAKGKTKVKVANEKKWKELLTGIDFNGIRHVIFHTRLASTGGKERKHPAMGKNWFLYQNGTVHYPEIIQDYFRTDWDTELTLKLVDRFKRVERVQEKLLLVNSVWIAVSRNDGTILIVNSGGNLTTSEDFTRITSEGEEFIVIDDGIVVISPNGKIEVSEDVVKSIEEQKEKRKKRTQTNYYYTYPNYSQDILQYENDEEDSWWDYIDDEEWVWKNYILLNDDKVFVISRYGRSLQRVLREDMTVGDFFDHKWESIIDREYSDPEVVEKWDEFLSLFKKRLLHEFWRRKVEEESDEKYKKTYRSYMAQYKMTRSERKKYRKLKKYFATTGLVEEEEEEEI